MAFIHSISNHAVTLGIAFPTCELRRTHSDYGSLWNWHQCLIMSCWTLCGTESPCSQLTRFPNTCITIWNGILYLPCRSHYHSAFSYWIINKNFMLLTFNEILIRPCFDVIIQIMWSKLVSSEYICIKEEINLSSFFEQFYLFSL